jgi:hypothetical protein
MKFEIAFILIALCLFSCNEKVKSKKIRQGNLIVTGDIEISNNDTIFNGEIKYYDNNTLVSKENYINNQRNGLSISYYANGVIKEESQYTLGLINGFERQYDKKGSIESIYYYYYGVSMGPLYNYENKIIKEYYFSDFEGHTLFSSFYDSLGNIIEKSKEYFFFTANRGSYESQSGIHLFMYLLSPPKLRMNYQICIKDSQDNIVEDVKVMTKRGLFIKPFLPELPEGRKYYISLDIFDSTTLTNQKYFREIKQ